MTLLISPKAQVSGNTSPSPPAAEPSIDIPRNALIYEAEDATGKKLVDVRTRWSGYSGEGYLDFQRKGAFAEWTISVSRPGDHTVYIRYASPTNSRYCDLLVDGTKIDEFDFPGSGWGEWNVEEIVLNLSAGEHKIRVYAALTGGPNIDFLAVLAPKNEVDIATATMSLP